MSKNLIKHRLHINWKHLFETSKNIDLLFAYAQTWRQSNVVELERFITNSEHTVRVLLPNPNYPLAVKVVALRSRKSEKYLKQLIEEAAEQFNNLKKYNTCKAYIEVKFLNFIPLYGWFSFDEQSVLTLHSHRKGRRGNPTFLLCDGVVTRHLKEDFDALFNSEENV